MFFKCLWSIIREFPHSIRGDSILLIIILPIIFVVYIPFNYRNILTHGILRNSVVISFIVILYIILFYLVYCMVIFLAPY